MPSPINLPDPVFSSPTQRPPALTRLAQERIASLDFLKGFLMLWIMYVHLGSYWGDGTFASAWRLVWLLLDWMGPVGFIAFTIIGTMLSYKKKLECGKTKGMGIEALKKFSFLFLIGELMNIVIDARNPVHLGPWHVLGMNMITAVAFAQLFAHAVLRLSQYQRLFLVAIMLIFFPLLFAFCLEGLGPGGPDVFIMEASRLTSAPAITYFLFFHMDSMMPTYGWLILTPLTIIMFDNVINAHLQGHVTAKKPNTRMTPLANLAVMGLVLAVLSILSGGFIVMPGIGGSLGAYINLVNPDPFRFWTLPGIPLFLWRFSPQYLCFSLGIIATTFALVYHVRDNGSTKSRPPTRIEIFGKYSFSVFVYSHVFGLIPLKVALIGFIALLFPILAALVFIVQVWDARLDGKGSLEWWLRKYMTLLLRIEQRRAKHAGKQLS
jgi:hypothetical protein